MSPIERRRGDDQVLAVSQRAIHPKECRDLTADAFTPGARLRREAIPPKLLSAVQRLAGNKAVSRSVAQLRVTAHADGTTSTTTTVQRDDAEMPAGDNTEAEQLDTSAEEKTPGTTNILPAKASTYPLSGSTLQDIADQIKGQKEAGKVEWSPTMGGTTAPNGKLIDATVDVNLTILMPDWTPPQSMGPKSKAEYARWYKALEAHEQGHIDLAEKYFKGLAKKMIGMKGAPAKKLLQDTKDALDAASKQYDKDTGNGTKNGTIIDYGIEQQEEAEKNKADGE